MTRSQLTAKATKAADAYKVAFAAWSNAKTREEARKQLDPMMAAQNEMLEASDLMRKATWKM